MSNSSLILRYPSPNIKCSKKDLFEGQTRDLNTSFAKITQKETNLPLNNENSNSLIVSKTIEISKESKKFVDLNDKLIQENNLLRKKLGIFEEKMINPKLFKNTDQILDFKGFIRTNFERFKELLNEVFSNKNALECEQNKFFHLK